MFCHKCGAKLDDDSEFCIHCGAKIKKEEENFSLAESDAANPIGISETSPESVGGRSEAGVTPDTQAQMSADEPPESRVMEGPQTVQPSAASGTSRSANKKLIAIAGTAVLVAGIAVGAFMARDRGPLKEYDYRKEININNGGFVTYDEDTLYFIGEYSEDDSRTSVYSTNYSGGDKKLLVENDDICLIREADGLLYYVEKQDDDGAVIKVMNTDGSNQKEIREIDAVPHQYDIVDGKLYYLVESRLECCKMDGSDSETIETDVNSFVIGEAAMYYEADGTVYSYDLKKEKSQELCRAEANWMVEKDGFLYMTGSGELNSVPVDGSGSISNIIRDDMMSRYIFWDDEIYYIHAMDSEEIAHFVITLFSDATESELKQYALIMIGSGHLYRANRNGGIGEEVDNSQGLMAAISSDPSNIWCKMSILSSQVEKLELE